jgi:hypothetical protein
LANGPTGPDSIDEAGARAYVGRDVIKDFDCGAFTGKVVCTFILDGVRLFGVKYEDSGKED